MNDEEGSLRLIARDEKVAFSSFADHQLLEDPEEPNKQA